VELEVREIVIDKIKEINVNKLNFSKIVLIALLVFLQSGCFLIFRQPRKRSFKYYDKNYVPDLKNSKLRTDGFYTTNKNWPWVIDQKKSCWFLHFDEKGKVVRQVSNCDASKMFIREDDEVFGYYKMDNDTVLFTLKAFYFRKQNIYKGIIYKDSILFKGSLYDQTYYFRPW